MAGATAAENQGGAAYVYYKATSAAYEQLGMISPQFTLNCSNPITVFSYPFTFGSDYTDTYLCNGVTSGEAFTRSNGLVRIAGASYGTLIMPYGTFTNVLMVDIEQTHTDVLASEPDFDFHYYSWTQMFIKPGIKQPLLANYENYTKPGPYQAFSRMLDENSTGVEEALRHDIGMDLFPNPATDRVEVLFSVPAGERLTIEVIDMLGQVVHTQQRPSLIFGMQREVIDLTGVAPGAYTVRLTDQKGAMGAKRFIKQ
jgi:hypothetical protein